MFKKYLILIGILFIGFPVCYAGRGCCSHHGGQSYCGANGRRVCGDNTYSPSCYCGGNTVYGYQLNQTKCSYGYHMSMDGKRCITLNEACKEQFGNYSKSVGNNMCGCEVGYVISPLGKGCVSLDEACKDQVGEHSIGVGTSQCGCEDGWVGSQYGQKCITSDEGCKEQFGPNYKWVGYGSGCTCEKGYLSNTKGICVEIGEACKDRYGEFSIPLRGDCRCAEGYMLYKGKCVPSEQVDDGMAFAYNIYRNQQEEEIRNWENLIDAMEAEMENSKNNAEERASDPNNICSVLSGSLSYYNEQSDSCVCKSNSTLSGDRCECISGYIEEYNEPDYKAECVSCKGKRGEFAVVNENGYCVCVEGYRMGVNGICYKVEKKKNNYGWIMVLLVVGGIFLYKKIHNKS